MLKSSPFSKDVDVTVGQNSTPVAPFFGYQVLYQVIPEEVYGYSQGISKNNNTSNL